MKDNTMQSLLYGLAALAAVGILMGLIIGVKSTCRKLLKKGRVKK